MNPVSLYLFSLKILTFLHSYDFIDEETLYHVKDTWENYFKLKEVIDNSYNFWKGNLQKR
ncbi:hypothetical protein FHY68_03285 [Bacillus pacificus]|nr:hypothetical protein FHY68_03285 [Bacillus pacificus]